MHAWRHRLIGTEHNGLWNGIVDAAVAARSTRRQNHFTRLSDRASAATATRIHARELVSCLSWLYSFSFGEGRHYEKKFYNKQATHRKTRKLLKIMEVHLSGHRFFCSISCTLEHTKSNYSTFFI